MLDPELVTRARGALLGLVAGNQLGVPTEHLGTPAAIRAAYPGGVRDPATPPKGSPYDDDAAMALLLGESLAERGVEPFEAGRRALAESTQRAAGNGAVMRCVPVAPRFHDAPERIIRVATLQAAIT